MTSTPPSRPPVEHTLLATRDPLVWADEFCRIFQGKTIGGPIAKGDVDEGTMVTWFANAMMVALDLHNQEGAEVEEVEAEPEPEDEPEELVMTPFEGDPDVDAPLTLEEQFKEGFDEGRG